MKRILTIVTLVLAFSCGLSAQGGYVTITPEYKPLTQQELELYARAEYARQIHKKEQFEKYKELAYERLQVLDYNGFIYYSDYALSFGWYNDKMYYDRGQAYEKLHEYRKAKKEYKKAIKNGYYPAKQALEQCKENHKRWKKNRK
jgi:hypothetical protein